MAISKVYIFIVTYILFTFSTVSQTIVSLERKKSAFSSSVGMYRKEPVLTFGYARAVHFEIKKILKEDVTLFVDLTDHSNFYNDNNFRFTCGGQGYLIHRKNWGMIFRKTFTLSRLQNKEVKATFLGAEFELLPGIYHHKYIIAASIYYGDSFKGHIIKQKEGGNLFSDVKNGWLKPHQQNLQLGINSGYYLNSKLLILTKADFFVLRPRHRFETVPVFHYYFGLSYIF